MKVVHISANGEYKDNPITKGFNDNGYEVLEVDYYDYRFNQKLNEHHFGNLVYRIVENYQPNFVFMQVQGDGIIHKNSIHQIRSLCPVVNWTGDVRDDVSFYIELANLGVLNLFVNQEDVNKIRELGFPSEYLQVSFHQTIHNPNNRADYNTGDIVFIGNNYDYRFPLSKERKDMCLKLYESFGDKFAVYGLGWGNMPFKANSISESECSQTYSQYKIAINHSHFLRTGYSSNRLFYILASGTFCLSQHYPKMEDEFEDGKHLVSFSGIDNLVDKCYFWLKAENESERNKIAEQGCNYVHQNCTWSKRIEQLKPIILKHYPYLYDKK